MATERPAKKGKKALDEERAKLAELSKGRGDQMQAVRGQLRTAAKVAGIALVVVWLVSGALASGLHTSIPLYVAAVLTVALVVAAVLVRRNLGKSEELGQLVAGAMEMSAEDRAARIRELDARVEKGEAAAIIAKAQLQMQDTPAEALVTLQKVDLEKAQKVVANQVRAMRAMIHLNQADVSEARALADAIDLGKAPDLPTRANLAGVVAEAWARSANPIEANELLDKYDADDKQFADSRVQLLRARVFARVHGNDLNGMKRALKQLEEISPQLLALFVSQKRIHPLLQQEAKRRLEKSGIMPRQRIMARR